MQDSRYRQHGELLSEKYKRNSFPSKEQLRKRISDNRRGKNNEADAKTRKNNLLAYHPSFSDIADKNSACHKNAKKKKKKRIFY